MKTPGVEPLKILHVEDHPADSAVAGERLERGGLPANIDRVATMDSFREALASGGYDLILSGYSIPGMDPLEVLRLARERLPDVPFIFLSGTVGEHQAVESLKLGATDYVLKHSLARLVPAVRRALVDRKEHALREEEAMERRRAEASLRQSEAKFRAVFEQAAVGIARVGFTDARWIDVNDAFCRMLGYTPDEMRALSWPQITHPEDVDVDLVPFRRMAAGELETYSVEKRFLHKQGHPVWARLSLSLVRDAQGRPDYEIAVIEDISERKQAQTAVEMQARLIQLSPTATIVRSLSGDISFWSAGAETLYGYTSQEAIGRTTQELLHTEFPSPLPEIVAQLRTVGHWSGELRHQAKDGRRIIVESHWLGKFAPDGEVLELLESNLDITQRKRLESELQRHAADLEQLVHERTAKLEQTVAELEHFSYTLTHDMRAPLRAMTGFASILATSHAGFLAPEALDLLRRISEAAVRMDHLITDALNYSHVIRAHFELEPVDPIALLRGMIESYPRFQPPNADILVDPNIPRVCANQAALTQCFSNLLENAVKFVAPGVTPRIRIRAEEPAHPTLNSKPSVRIWVEDNGIGIAPEHQKIIWQMFQRLSPNYEGTGIGLALVRKVAERMQGKAGVESAPGQGSRFWIELPLPE